jgi:hypothetical protein
MISQEVYNECREKLAASNMSICSTIIQFNEQHGGNTVKIMLADHQCDVESEEELIKIVDHVVALSSFKWM